MKDRKIIPVMIMLVFLCSLILPAKAADRPSEPEKIIVPTISLDNKNRYEGMDCSYSEGYMPSVSGGYAAVVLPLLCDGELNGSRLNVSVNLGDASTMPFVCKNYEKTAELAENPVNGTETMVSGYLAAFDLELSDKRVNGNYPVLMQVSGTDTGGNPVEEEFTVYVVIKDGIDPAPPKDDAPKEEPVVYVPKVLVKSCECKKTADADGEEDSGTLIAPGDRFQLTITLWNTSESENLKNTSVAITSPAEGFTLLSASNVEYVGDFGAGQILNVTFDYQANRSALPGQYDFALTCDYGYGKGETAQSSGTAKVGLAQRLKVRFDDLEIPEEVTVSDTITVSVQAMNLGKTAVYNVRAVVQSDGLNPKGTIFIGNIEAGNAASASTEVTVTGLAQEGSPYGQTKGTVTYYYEDTDGTEHSEDREFAVTVVSPFSEDASVPEDEPGQWWKIMLIITIVIVVLAAVLAADFLKRRKKYEAAD